MKLQDSHGCFSRVRQVDSAAPPPPDLYVVKTPRGCGSLGPARPRCLRLEGLEVELDMREATEGLVVLKDLRGEAAADQQLAPEAVARGPGPVR
jgi:hypothetical protein